MTGALQGVAVVEVANYLTGPYAGMLLGDLGADVIKVEEVGSGDPFRGWDEQGYASVFRALNRNKRSVALNLKTDEGREVFLRLAERADVLIQNFRPDVVRRLRIDYDTLSTRNPRLVYCSISGFGEDGAYRDWPGYDTVGQAMGGLLSLLTDLDEPAPVGISLSDHVTGMFACYGVLAALLARERTGRGQLVTTSLLQSTASFVQEAAARFFTKGEVPRRETRARSAQVYAFSAGDGLPFVVHLSSPPKFWDGLTAAVGKPELRDDPRFRDRPSRARNYSALREELETVFRGAPRERWLERLREQDVPCAPIRSLDEVFRDPEILAQGMLVELEHPRRGTVRCSGNPVGLSASPVSYRLAPPLLGEHTHEVLGELGYGREAVAGLCARGVLGVGE